MSWWQKNADNAAVVMRQWDGSSNNVLSIQTDGTNPPGNMQVYLGDAASGWQPSQFDAAYGGYTSAWKHYLVVFDGTLAIGSRARLFIDGTEQTRSSGTGAGASIGTNTEPFVVGLDHAGSSATYFAEVAIWIGSAITDAGKIAQLVAGDNPLAVQSSNLAFYARYKDDANDQIGALTGTVTSATYEASENPAVDDPPSGGSTFVPQVIMVL